MGSDSANSKNGKEKPTEILVGQKARELRTAQKYSLKTMAERSGLNINTLCLIENGKTSPSVGTLQQLSKALDVPITAFFESEPEPKKVVFSKRGQRTGSTFSDAYMQNLGKDLAASAIQPFEVTLKPGAGSGVRKVVHTGFEFVYCLEGTVTYWIEEEEFELRQGDSVVFEAHLPHQWENSGSSDASIILVIVPTDSRDEPGSRHFSLSRE